MGHIPFALRFRIYPDFPSLENALSAAYFLIRWDSPTSGEGFCKCLQRGESGVE